MKKKIILPRYVYASYNIRYANLAANYIDECTNYTLRNYFQRRVSDAYRRMTRGGYDLWPRNATSRFVMDFVAEDIERAQKIRCDKQYARYSVEVEPPADTYVTAIKEYLSKLPCKLLQNDNGDVVGAEYKYSEYYNLWNCCRGKNIDEHALYIATEHPSSKEYAIAEGDDGLDDPPEMLADFIVEPSYEQKALLDRIQASYDVWKKHYQFKKSRESTMHNAIKSIFDSCSFGSREQSKAELLKKMYELCKAFNTMDYGFGVFAYAGFKF